jgi:hypothetical protein
MRKIFIGVSTAALLIGSIDSVEAASHTRRVRPVAKPIDLLPGWESFRAQQPSTVSNMPFASTPLSGSEWLYLVQGGISKKITVSTFSQNNAIVIGSTPVTGCSNSGYTIYDNNGVIGCQAAGGGSVVVSGAPVAPQQTQWVDSTTIKGVNQGVFNVRTMFGGVPDGVTNNATAIAAAFTASNAFNSTPNSGASGVPTVYFDCDTGATTCEYNYGGSGTSPINPTVPTTILCAPGVSLNYTGTAHAVDLGPSGLVAQATIGRYIIQGCQFTGGTNYTAGIFPNTFLENLTIQNTAFVNFGNQTAYNILISGQNYRMKVLDSNFINTDGASRNILDSHTAGNPDLIFSRNKTSCLNAATNAACTTIGLGLWINGQSVIDDNEITFYQPLIRISGNSGGSGGRARITNNFFEGEATNAARPAITYGDPGVAAQNVGFYFGNNQVYFPLTGGVPMIGPETPSSGNNICVSAEFVHNFLGPAPGGSTEYINCNSGDYTYLDDNIGPTATSGPLSQSSSPPLLDSGSINVAGVNGSRLISPGVQGQGGALANSIAAWDSTGSSLNRASFAAVSTPMFCHYTGASGTAATCSTSPAFSPAGSAFAPVAGSMIIFETATANTGTSYTIAVNGGSALSVLKNGNALAIGDIPANIPEVLLFDGTSLQYNHP